MFVSHADTPERLAAVRELLGDYADFLASMWPEVDRSAFDEEAGMLETVYRVILVAEAGGEVCGCVMLRDDPEPGLCEARRLFVRPRCRRQGVGRALMDRLMEEARALGYERMRLVTVTLFEGAIPLYESLGFRRIEPFRETSVPVVVFMERDLRCAQ